MSHMIETLKRRKHLKAAPRPEAKPEARVSVDFPSESERISPFGYTIRVGAPEDCLAEVSIDGGDWQPCRRDVGYWWFDWMSYAPGEHEVLARAVLPDGTILSSERRRLASEL